LTLLHTLLTEFFRREITIQITAKREITVLLDYRFRKQHAAKLEAKAVRIRKHGSVSTC
jgi:hypothetical protein